MTVQELIKILEKKDQDAEIWVEGELRDAWHEPKVYQAEGCYLISD